MMHGQVTFEKNKEESSECLDILTNAAAHRTFGELMNFDL